MARNFDGSDVVITSLGGCGIHWFGTMAAIVRKQSDGAGKPIFEAGSGSTARFGIYFNSTNKLGIRAETDRNSTTTVVAADGWVLVAATKATGTVTPRAHFLKAGTWTHESASGTMADNVGVPTTRCQIGRNQAASAFFNGDIAVVGVWNTEFSDAQVEALAGSLLNWHTIANPIGLWVLDQADTGMLISDSSGNGAGETSLTGTTVSTSHPHLPFSYGALPILSSIAGSGAPEETDFAPSGISVPVTFGTETFDLETGVEEPDGISVPVTFGTVTFDLDTGVAPSGIAVPVTFGDITISEAGLFADGIAVPVTFGTPSFAHTQEFTPSGIAVSITFGDPVIEDLDTGITLSGIAVPVTFGTISTSLDFEFAPSGIAVPVTFGTEALSLVTGYAPSGFTVAVNVGTFGASFSIIRVTTLTLHYSQRVEVVDYPPRSAILHYAPSGWTVIME